MDKHYPKEEFDEEFKIPNDIFSTSRQHPRPFKTWDYTGYSSGKTRFNTKPGILVEYQPERKYAASILDLDCTINRKELIERWVTEMSLIIQTDDNLIDDLDLILLLAKHKTAGNVKKFIESLDWEGYKQNKNGEQFFAIIASFIYSIFEGTDVAGNLISEIEKQKENAKAVFSKIQLCNLCQFEYFHCEYEKHLYHIPFLEQTFVSNN